MLISVKECLIFCSVIIYCYIQYPLFTVQSWYCAVSLIPGDDDVMIVM